MISVVALALGWEPHASLAAVALTVVLGTAAFASLGLFVAGVLRAEATLAAANLVYLLLLAGGAVVLPSSAYGGFGDVARLLPSGALATALRQAFWSGTFDWTSLLVLLVWTGDRRRPDREDVHVGVSAFGRAHAGCAASAGPRSSPTSASS